MDLAIVLCTFFASGIGMTLNSLGRVYRELGYLTQSLQMLQRSQSIGREIYSYNPKHPQVGKSGPSSHANTTNFYLSSIYKEICRQNPVLVIIVVSQVKT